VDKILSSIDQLRKLMELGDTKNQANLDPVLGLFSNNDSNLGTGSVVDLLY